MTKDELKDALIDALRESAALRAELARLRPLARFGAECLREHRNAGEPSDLDGGWLQDQAIEGKLLAWKMRRERCDWCAGCEPNTCEPNTDGKYRCLDYAPGVAGTVEEVTR